MSTRRLEEILEECVSAYLEGRRSIEESLSLYPAFAAQLEPLLRTAAGVNYTFGSYSPPAHVENRGLNRFLSDARARRNMRALRVGSMRPSGFASLWERARVGFAAAALAIVVLAGAAGGILVLGGSGSGSTALNPTTGSPAPGTPQAVLNLNQAIDNIRGKQNRGEPVVPSDLDQLTRATKALQHEQVEQAPDAVTAALTDVNTTILPAVAAENPDLAPQAQAAADAAADVASANQLPVPTAAPIFTGTPTATPEATPESTPTVTEPGQTDAPTPVPTDTPVPTEPGSPTPTPEPRGVDGLGG